MTLIEKLRQDMELAIATFMQSHKAISLNRQNDIDEIRRILKSNNPLKVKTNLTQYSDHLSSGFIAIWPFLEVNRLKRSLCEVLKQPQYQESSILKSMMLEAGIRLNQDNITASSDRSILSRVEKLEASLSLQQKEMSGLHDEIKRLKVENQFLTKALSRLTDKNKALTSENLQLNVAKLKFQNEAQDLKQKYQALAKENSSLKNQLLLFTSPQEFKASSTKGATTKNKISTKNTIHTNHEEYIELLRARSDTVEMPQIPQLTHGDKTLAIK